MNRPKAFFSAPAGDATLVGIFALFIYLKTSAPSVTFIDAGELAAVACTLGIAHPTGYPLFTLLGWFFSKLPIASEEIVRLNIMAAFFCSVGVFVFYHLSHLLLEQAFGRSSVLKFRKKEMFPLALRAASAGAALLLAFSETYWSQAVGIEVYSLHVLLVCVSVFAFFKAVIVEKEYEENGDGRNVWWYVFALALGLSFTNHMTTILLAPGCLYLYFATQGFTAASWKRIGGMAVLFAIGFSVYLYLPVRAAQSPVLNWGNPETLEKFLWHWTGKQYRVWIFSSTEAAGRQLKYFLESLPAEFAYVGIVAAILGVWLMWKAHKRFAITLLLLFLGCVFYSINYDIHDIDSYFLLAYIAVAVLAAAGLMALYRRVCESMSGRAALVVTMALSFAPCVMHFNSKDQSENYLVEDYTKNMFASLKQNALVFSFQWDYWVSASYYYQHVKRYRTDVAVVDKELLRRSWYFKQLEQSYPWLIEESRAEVDAFLKELYKFEHNLPYDPRVIEGRFVGMIRSFIERSLRTRPVYVTTEMEPEFTAGMQRVPEGLALRVYADTLGHEMRTVRFQYRPFDRSGRLEDALVNLYATACNAEGLYWMQRRHVDSATAAFRRALEFNPNSTDAMNLLRQVQAITR